MAVSREVASYQGQQEIVDAINGFTLSGVSQKAVWFDSVSSMQRADIPAGATAATRGYTTVNDGGNAFYYIREKTQSDVEDGGSIIFLDNENVAELIPNGTANVKQFGAVGDGTTDDTTAIQNCLNAGAQTVVFPKGTYYINKVYIHSNTKLVGNDATIICYSDTATSMAEGALLAYFDDDVLQNVTIDGLKFDGNKANIDNPYHQIIWFYCDSLQTAKNIFIKNCVFESFREDAICFVYHDNSVVDCVIVDKCKFFGVDETTRKSGNAVRFVLNTYVGTYGTYPAHNITVTDCYAEKCRTLADIKRGCQNVYIANCHTKNMEDCHHSIDGSNGVVIDSCFCEMDADFTPSTGSNFVEIQGENVTLSNLFGDGNGITRDGVQVTTYANPDESETYHQSQNIKILNCYVKGVYRHGYNANGTDTLLIKNCLAEGTGTAEQAFSCLNDLDIAKDYTIVDCSFSGFSNYIGTQNTHPIDHLKIERCYDENHTTPLYLTVLGNDLRNIPTMDVDFGENVCINTPLNLASDGTTIDGFTTSNGAVVLTTDLPPVWYKAVTVTDTSSSNLGEYVYLPIIPASKGDLVTVKIMVKSNTATQMAILCKEYNGATWLSNRFMGYSDLTSDWVSLIGQARVSNDNTNRIVLAIIPAASYNNPSLTGRTDVAHFEFFVQRK